MLLTGGTDGVVCVFDASLVAPSPPRAAQSSHRSHNTRNDDDDGGDGGAEAQTDDDALQHAMSVGAPVSSLGFALPDSSALWVTTSTEDVSLWRLGDGGRLGASPAGSTRTACTAAASSCGLLGPNEDIQYLVGCGWDACSGLSLLAGRHSGFLASFPLSLSTGSNDEGGPMIVCPPSRVLDGSHSDTVRAVAWPPLGAMGAWGGRGGCDAGVCVTAGEDGRVVMWGQPAQRAEMQPHAGGATLGGGGGGGGGGGAERGVRDRERSPMSDGRWSPY